MHRWCWPLSHTDWPLRVCGHGRRRFRSYLESSKALLHWFTYTHSLGSCVCARCSATSHYAPISSSAHLSCLWVFRNLPFFFVILNLFSDFVALPMIFYLVILAGGFNINDLRHHGWVFDVGEARDPWYKFYMQFGECLMYNSWWVKSQGGFIWLYHILVSNLLQTSVRQVGEPSGRLCLLSLHYCSSTSFIPLWMYLRSVRQLVMSHCHQVTGDWRLSFYRRVTGWGWS